MRLLYLIQVLLILQGIGLRAQTITFRDQKKWGLKEGEQIIAPAIYDTIFAFDSTANICLACHKTKTASANKFMKVLSTTYSCNYLSKKNERLYIKNQNGDTCSVFSLAKSSLKQYQNNSPYFIATVKSKKYLLKKDFTQLTYNDYQEISFSEDPYFYVTQKPNDFEVLCTGLVNKKEEEVVPYLYSGIKVNTEDSLIIACSASVRPNAEDDVYNYEGKKVASSFKHIDMATKNFLIHKLYEPKEHYLIYDLKSRQEKQLVADEVAVYLDDEILIRIKNDWFVYDLQTNLKKPKTKL